MKDLGINEQSKDKVVIVSQAEQKKISRFNGSIKIHKGHTLFEINLEEKSIVAAEFESKDYVVDGRNSLKVLEKKNCVYIPALNEKNALKKLIKLAAK